MNIKLFLHLGLALCLTSAATYADTSVGDAGSSSLWGEVDTAIPTQQQVEKAQQAVVVEQQAIDNERTICEVLSEQVLLTNDKDNAAKIQEALARAFKTASAEYKILLSNTDAANDLYVKYRDLYLQTYCIAASSGGSNSTK